MALGPQSQNDQKSTQPKSVLAAAHALLGLPLEIMHQIVEDVPLFRIIQMAASLEDPTYFYECLVSHPKFRDLGFTSTHHLSHIGSLHGLYYDIGKSGKLRDRGGVNAREASSPLAKSLNVIMLDNGEVPFKTYDELRDYLLQCITSMLIPSKGQGKAWIWEAEIQVYLQGRISQDWHRNTLEDMQQFWERKQEGRRSNNARKSAQIAKTANIFESFPTSMKKTSDPSPLARPNSNHIVSNLRSYSDVFARRDEYPKKRPRTSGNHLFRFDLFPIVPVDAWLRLFVDTLKRHPLPSHQIIKHAYPASSEFSEVSAEYPEQNENPEAYLSQAVQSLSITSTSCIEVQPTAVKKLNYPPHIIENIEIAIAGMAYVYTLPDKSTGWHPKVLRTKYTPWSADPFRKPFPTKKTNTSDATQTEQPAAKSPWADFPSNKPPPRPTLTPRKKGKMKQQEPRGGGLTPRPVKTLQYPLPTNQHQEPIFMAPPYRHFKTAEARVKVDDGDVKYYYDTGIERTHRHEMEFEWLEAFLNACDFMRGINQ